MPYQDADALCKSHGFELAKIFNEDDNLGIYGVKNSQTTSWLGASRPIFDGLNQKEMKAAFKWDNGLSVCYDAWHSTQPNNYGWNNKYGSGEYHLSVKGPLTAADHMNDADAIQSFPALCEYRCSNCDVGFHLENNIRSSGDSCVANVCRCGNGPAHTGPACPINGEHGCASCNSGFTHIKLSNGDICHPSSYLVP